LIKRSPAPITRYKAAPKPKRSPKKHSVLRHAPACPWWPFVWSHPPTSFYSKVQTWRIGPSLPTCRCWILPTCKTKSRCPHLVTIYSSALRRH